jgi:hypothetical protein
MITRDERKVEVLFISLAVTGYVRNITKMLTVVKSWKGKRFVNRSNYMVSVTNESYVNLLIK